MARGVLWVLICLFAVSATALEAPLAYEKLNGADVSPGMDYLSNVTTPFPGTDWKAPALVAAKPLYVTIKAGDRLLIVDQQKKEDTFYNRVYFDANGNRDLTDDPPIDGTFYVQSSFSEAKFAAIEFADPAKKLQYCFNLEVQQFKPGMVVGLISRLAGGGGIDEPRAIVKPQCAYAAEIEVEGKKYQVRLHDNNANGKFDDIGMAALESTGFLKSMMPTGITLKQMVEGISEAVVIQPVGEQTVQMWQPLGHYLAIGHSTFSFSPKIAEGKLVLSPVEGDSGKLKLADTFETMTLQQRDGKTPARVMMYRPADGLTLPCGKYVLLKYDAIKKADNGDVWAITGDGVNDTATIAVEKDKEAAAPFGQPFTGRALVEGDAIKYGFFGGASATLSFVMEGSGKETLGQPTLKVGMSARMQQSPTPPSFKVTKSDGEVVAQGEFRYG